jgi:hypothetical protein
MRDREMSASQQDFVPPSTPSNDGQPNTNTPGTEEQYQVAGRLDFFKRLFQGLAKYGDDLLRAFKDPKQFPAAVYKILETAGVIYTAVDILKSVLPEKDAKDLLENLSDSSRDAVTTATQNLEAKQKDVAAKILQEEAKLRDPGLSTNQARPIVQNIHNLQAQLFENSAAYKRELAGILDRERLNLPLSELGRAENLEAASRALRDQATKDTNTAKDVRNGTYTPNNVRSQIDPTSTTASSNLPSREVVSAITNAYTEFREGGMNPGDALMKAIQEHGQGSVTAEQGKNLAIALNSAELTRGEPALG